MNLPQSNIVPKFFVHFSTYCKDDPFEGFKSEFEWDLSILLFKLKSISE